jgi:two-component system sensor histidine kinase KdpD
VSDVDQKGVNWRDAAFAIAVLALATLVSLALRSLLTATNLVMVYLLGVVAIAIRCSQQVSVAASIISVAAFDFFCVPPYLTFVISDYEYLVTFAGMLVVALVISTQTARIRASVLHAMDREARTKALYRLSSALAGQTRAFEIARAAAELAGQVLKTTVVIFLPDQGKVSFRKRTSEHPPIPMPDESIAQWAFDKGRKAGCRMENFSDATALYLPLRGASDVYGVMYVVPGGEENFFSADQQNLLDLFANQTASAIERSISQKAAEDTRLTVEVEQMRSSLLSAVSHDLRTPLASITGAASSLRSQWDRLTEEVREELLESISEEAERLSRLVDNLLDMTRFESGKVELRRDFCPLEEIVGSALQRMGHRMKDRPLTMHLPADLPPVFGDDVLLGQVVINLLENALKYTPPGAPLELEAWSAENKIILEIRDRGPGLPAGEEDRIFDKFYRGASGSVRGNVRGAGLGLAICRAIVQAHEGSIQAFNRPEGGAVFRVQLPLVPLEKPA